MGIEIRAALPEDAPTLSALMGELTGQPPQLALLIPHLMELATDPSYFLAVALVDGLVAGTAMGIRCRDINGDLRPFLVIENVVVSPAYRRLGLGKRLMERIENWGRAQKCSYAMLVSGAPRINAHRFYEAIGYSREAGFKKRGL